MGYRIFFLVLCALLGWAGLHQHQTARDVPSLPKTHSTAVEVEKAAKERFKTASAYISPGRYGTERHIKQRHWFNAAPGTSHFNQSMTIEKLHALATETLNKGDKRLGHNGKMIHQYRFERPIGTASSGRPAYSLRVVTPAEVPDNQSVHVITAFPVN